MTTKASIKVKFNDAIDCSQYNGWYCIGNDPFLYYYQYRYSRKMAIVDWRCTPLIAIDDPKLMIAKPAGLTAATGMDALTHAVEAYVSTAANPITDACAEKAITMISQWLQPAVANGENIEARDAMSYAQYLAGMAFNNASLGYVHAMAHQLGGFYNLPHGVCNAILLPHVCEFNLIACPDRYAKNRRINGCKYPRSHRNRSCVCCN